MDRQINRSSAWPPQQRWASSAAAVRGRNHGGRYKTAAQHHRFATGSTTSENQLIFPRFFVFSTRAVPGTAVSNDCPKEVELKNNRTKLVHTTPTATHQEGCCFLVLPKVPPHSSGCFRWRSQRSKKYKVQPHTRAPHSKRPTEALTHPHLFPAAFGRWLAPALMSARTTSACPFAQDWCRAVFPWAS